MERGAPAKCQQMRIDASCRYCRPCFLILQQQQKQQLERMSSCITTEARESDGVIYRLLTSYSDDSTSLNIPYIESSCDLSVLRCVVNWFELKVSVHCVSFSVRFTSR